MIIPIHPNEDAEEFADGGHVGVLGLIESIFRLRRKLSLQKSRNRCPMYPEKPRGVSFVFGQDGAEDVEISKHYE